MTYRYLIVEHRLVIEGQYGGPLSIHRAKALLPKYRTKYPKAEIERFCRAGYRFWRVRNGRWVEMSRTYFSPLKEDLERWPNHIPVNAEPPTPEPKPTVAVQSQATAEEEPEPKEGRKNSPEEPRHADD